LGVGHTELNAGNEGAVVPKKHWFSIVSGLLGGEADKDQNDRETAQVHSDGGSGEGVTEVSKLYKGFAEKTKLACPLVGKFVSNKMCQRPTMGKRV